MTYQVFRYDHAQHLWRAYAPPKLAAVAARAAAGSIVSARILCDTLPLGEGIIRGTVAA